MAAVKGFGCIGELGRDRDGHNMNSVGIEAWKPADQVFLDSFGNHRYRSGAAQRQRKPKLAKDFAFEAPQLMQPSAIMNGYDGASRIGAEGREMNISGDMGNLSLVCAGESDDLQSPTESLADVWGDVQFGIHAEIKQRLVKPGTIAF